MSTRDEAALAVLRRLASEAGPDGLTGFTFGLSFWRFYPNEARRLIEAFESLAELGGETPEQIEIAGREAVEEYIPMLGARP